MSGEFRTKRDNAMGGVGSMLSDYEKWNERMSPAAYTNAQALLDIAEECDGYWSAYGDSYRSSIEGLREALERFIPIEMQERGTKFEAMRFPNQSPEKAEWVTRELTHMRGMRCTREYSATPDTDTRLNRLYHEHGAVKTQVSIHESSHAIIGELGPFTVHTAQLKKDGGGVCRFSIPKEDIETADYLVRNLSGTIAERIAGDKVEALAQDLETLNRGARSDFEKAGERLSLYRAERGDSAADEVRSQANARARWLVNSNWDRIVATAEVLAEDGCLAGFEVRGIIEADAE